MRKALLAAGITAALAVGLVGFTGLSGATPPNPEHKVDVCHRTGSATNPYVFINVDIASSGYVKGGHNNHEQVGNGLGGDIIAAYTYEAKNGDVFNYPGKNLDTIIGGVTGAELLANGCDVPSEVPEEPIFEPAASVTTDCDEAAVTLDNSASEDGDEATAEVTFTVFVNGEPVGDPVTLAAGAGALLPITGLADGDVITVTSDATEGTLATTTVSLDGCGKTTPPPPPDNEPPTVGEPNPVDLPETL